MSRPAAMLDPEVLETLPASERRDDSASLAVVGDIDDEGLTALAVLLVDRALQAEGPEVDR